MLGNAPVAAVLTTSNLNVARDFYAGKLGLQVVQENPGNLFFQAGGGTQLVVYERPGSASESTVAGFQVASVPDTVHALQDKGVVCEIYDMPNFEFDEFGVATTPDGTHMAWFKDPEGNVIALAEQA